MAGWYYPADMIAWRHWSCAPQSFARFSPAMITTGGDEIIVHLPPVDIHSSSGGVQSVRVSDALEREQWQHHGMNDRQRALYTHDIQQYCWRDDDERAAHDHSYTTPYSDWVLHPSSAASAVLDTTWPSGVVHRPCWPCKAVSTTSCAVRLPSQWRTITTTTTTTGVDHSDDDDDISHGRLYVMGGFQLVD